MLQILKPAGRAHQHLSTSRQKGHAGERSCARATEQVLNASRGRDDTDKHEIYQRLRSMKYNFHMHSLCTSFETVIQYQYGLYTQVDEVETAHPRLTCCLPHWAPTSTAEAGTLYSKRSLLSSAIIILHWHLESNNKTYWLWIILQ